MSQANTMSAPQPSVQSTPSRKGKRVRVGVMAASIVLTFIYLGSWWWTSFVAFFLFAGFNEMTVIMASMNTRPSKLIVLVMGLLMLIVATLDHPSFLPPLLTLAVMFSFFRLLFRQPVGSMADIGGTLLSIVYLAYFPLHYILLRQLKLPPPQEVAPALSSGMSHNIHQFFVQQPGCGYLFLAIAVIACSDIVAYYTGKKFGRSLLYPEVSPKKTREGALGGVAGGFTAGLIASWIIGFPLEHGMILSVLLTIVGQIGDLVESTFKRSAGVKDSGGLLHGHGGLLDRADSYIFSGAVAYYYIYWVVLGQGLAEDVARIFGQITGVSGS